MPFSDYVLILTCTQGVVQHLRKTLPMLPDELLAMLTSDPSHGLTMKDAKTLISQDDGDRLEYYMNVLDHVQAEMGSETANGLGEKVGNW
jgi:aspartyl-tRNA(Asn)/glutamyl-tRNA(Gln) amidotransferase subunit B